ncbi:oxidase [Lithospermum erythrorhizon]|uniref:laccase n=1 Tax=Lithospermum erythrorhizon TaxID=34254 RepID=A0AAV3PJN4_LITER
MSCWADGIAFITQCPIRSGRKFTYKFQVNGQEGTLWWHAHVGFHRATVYGAIVIYPSKGQSYPFPKPDEEQLIILGEWWNRNITELQNELNAMGIGPESSDANLINGWPGDMYSCNLASRRRRFLKYEESPIFHERQRNSTIEMSTTRSNQQPGSFRLNVKKGKTYLLRIINANLDPSIFFKIANHEFVIVATDASYTNPFRTDVIIISPGQTFDVLFTADQTPGLYYLTTSVFVNSDVEIVDTPGTAVVVYEDVDTLNAVPTMPIIPDHHDNDLFYGALRDMTGLVTSPFWEPVPLEIDERMIITIGLGFQPCSSNPKVRCHGLKLSKFRISGSLSNFTFALPDKKSILEAHYKNIDGIFTDDFPNQPPLMFNFTADDYKHDLNVLSTEMATKVKKFKFNSSVEIVFQCTSLVTPENHPMHLHGHNFHILGMGFGTYDPARDSDNLNYVNPVLASTVSVPKNGWTVIRFRANNPGAWFLHCHNEGHLVIGLAGVFIVEDGPNKYTSLPAPPIDYPRC